MRRFALLVTLAGGALGPRAAHANPASLVPAGGGANLWFDYDYQLDSATIGREHVGDPTTDPLAPIPVRKDLVFHQFQHTLTPRVDVGIYHDSWFTVALPIIIAQARQLELDTGVDHGSSSTISDGFLPPTGFDGQQAGGALVGNQVFRGATRRGLDQIHLGLGFAPMNQAHDPTKPTWKLGGELRLAVGSVMSLDAQNPTANASVGRGVHELKLWTSFDKHIGWAEPHVEIFWQVPIGTTSSSLFVDPGFGATNVALGQKAGVEFGFEAAAVDDKLAENRISLDLGSRVVGHFEGRDYSEMWEVFRIAGDPSIATNPLILDSDPTMAGRQDLQHPGISSVENYLELAASAAIRAELGTHVRLSLLGEVIVRTDHAITFADSGVDLPTCTGSRTTGCETDVNDVVNPGTKEVNPAFASKIDLVGHRYRSEHDLGVVLGLQAQIVF